ncbi:hypothetical protein Pan14r_18160 [Crateriforma conspicua]|uniref:Metal-binding protein n=1 Tax=Crateriforma conspicua TaxID=2527996 RepID=A0A5C5Y3L5_9PLAN|nr:YecH family metal-binding protein [Crateriforma conspicua]QDV64135.1 hypothetical protein Mal65_32850 [Crateriforma conspicua]TWT69528.1 hypothetical protein Pan14r_18160 [Crateriforma conspicua]
MDTSNPNGRSDDGKLPTVDPVSSDQPEIHGHEVMRMMVESGQAYDADSLQTAVIERFGVTARFCTCSASGMTAAELVVFLDQRGKLTPTDGGFTTTPDKICDH